MIQEVEEKGDAKKVVNRHPRPPRPPDGLRSPRLSRGRPARPRPAPYLQGAECASLRGPPTPLEQAALAELRERRPDRPIETNVEFWAAVILDFADVPPHMIARDVHLCPYRWLVGAHHGAEADRTPRTTVGPLHRSGTAQAKRRRRLGRHRPRVIGVDLKGPTGAPALVGPFALKVSRRSCPRRGR